MLSLQVMNADRFDGPYSNLCENTPVAPQDSGGEYSTAQVIFEKKPKKKKPKPSPF